ncbi:MAG: efflux RND transporter permease subunit [Spirochaetales bacterium]|nr:efflux RND transporter permease subunit [Spirochaetales bacterium]MCF7939109.1 efflux RND transporter permease subunit [Spirochaetales bacterium]
MSIGKFSVHNSVFINLLMVTLLVLGFFSLSRLPREQFSEVPFYWVQVSVPYPGVSAEDIEQSITIKIEEEFRNLDKVDQINSVSSEGFAYIRVEFDDGISDNEFRRLFQDAQTRLSNVNLPEDSLKPTVDDFSSNDFLPVIEVILSGNVEYKILNRTAKRLKDRIEPIQDVSDVELVGSRDKEIHIEADRRKMEALGISLNEIIRSIDSRNITIPAGSIETPSREYLIRTIGEVEDPLELERIIIRTDSGGIGRVRLGDLADISLGYNPDGVYNRLNGKQAISLRVTKIPKGNAVDIVERLKQDLQNFESSIPEGIEYTLFNDSTIQIRDSLDVLVNNAFFGLLLLIIILFLFIGIRNALIIGLGIPVAFAITFLILEQLGQTFNTNTLFGLVLVLGLIVDHAIVIIENSYRLQQEGLSKIDAAVKGVNEVSKPVIASTLTTVAAFLPLMILPGTIGKFLRVIPLVVSVALLASTFEALVFLPVHFAEWSGKLKQGTGRFFTVLRNGFEKLLRVLFKRKILTVVGMFLVIIFSFQLISTVDQDLFSAEDFTLFYIDVEMPVGTPREKTDQVVSRYEDRIIPLVGNGEIVSVSSTIGYLSSESSASAGNNVAQLIVDITETSEGRSRSLLTIMNEVEKLCSDIPGPESVQYRTQQNGPPTDPPVSFRLFGDNYDEMTTIAEEITERLSGYSELYNISDNLEQGTPELWVRVNEERAANFGLTTRDIGSYLRASFEGITATTIFSENEEIDAIVSFGKQNEMTVQELTQLRIPAPNGQLIPFSSVADVSGGDTFASIKRVDLKREVTVTAEAYDSSVVPSINGEIRDLFDSQYAPKYPGIELQVGGEFAEFASLLQQIIQIFLIGLFLIYIILGTQFKSYIQPVLILFTVPFAFVGVILFLVISGTPFSTTVIYAAVALAGIAVNDSIVLISFANDLRKEGWSLTDAVIHAAGTRLRPILLTSFTTIGGLIPTALGIGGESVVWGPMASTIIFGLIFSTISSLVFIPCLYGILESIRNKVMKKKVAV